MLAIEHRASSSLIGHVGFSPFDDDVEIGLSVAQQYQRQGLASEAIIAASRRAFEAFALDRIVAITSATNLASRRTLLRARFVYEGDQTMRFQGAEEEVSVYALPGNSGQERGAQQQHANGRGCARRPMPSVGQLAASTESGKPRREPT